MFNLKSPKQSYRFNSLEIPNLRLGDSHSRGPTNRAAGTPQQDLNDHPPPAVGFGEPVQQDYSLTHSSLPTGGRIHGLPF
jgi:hypothetical protein